MRDEVVDKMQAADAMRYKGTTAAALPTTAPADTYSVGDTYKATAEFKQGNQQVYIGDLLIAKGTEEDDGFISGTITWDYVPSGFVADYNPELSVGASAVANNDASIVLTRGDETQNIVTIQRASGNETLTVNSVANGNITLSLEWGTF